MHQTGGGPLDPGHRQIGQFGRHLRGIAERPDRVIVVIEPEVTTKGLPEGIDHGGARPHAKPRVMALDRI